MQKYICAIILLFLNLQLTAHVKKFLNKKNFLSVCGSIFQIRSPYQGKLDGGCGWFAYKNTGQLLDALRKNTFESLLQNRQEKGLGGGSYYGLRRRAFLSFRDIQNHQAQNTKNIVLQDICTVNLFKDDCFQNVRFLEKVEKLQTLQCDNFGIVADFYMNDYAHKISLVVHRLKSGKIIYFFQDSLNYRFAPCPLKYKTGAFLANNAMSYPLLGKLWRMIPQVVHAQAWDYTKKSRRYCSDYYPQIKKIQDFIEK